MIQGHGTCSQYRNPRSRTRESQTCGVRTPRTRTIQTARTLAHPSPWRLPDIAIVFQAHDDFETTQQRIFSFKAKTVGGGGGQGVRGSTICHFSKSNGWLVGWLVGWSCRCCSWWFVHVGSMVQVCPGYKHASLTLPPSSATFCSQPAIDIMCCRGEPLCGESFFFHHFVVRIYGARMSSHFACRGWLCILKNLWHLGGRRPRT